ncbi:MAG TPA: diguanylate cyclase [Dissulfurispiraceae bacterium]
MKKLSEAWIYLLKRRIIVSVLGVLTLFIVLTVFFIANTLRKNLIEESTVRTQELSEAIHLSLKALMLTRSPEMLQNAVEDLGKSNSSVEKAFILDRNGRIVYSSDRSEIGKVLDRYRESSCHGCHKKTGEIPSEHTLLIEKNGSKVHRNVKVIYNEQACFGCHSKSDRINGKLIIDRSLKGTYATIASVEAIIFGSGLLCVILLVPFLSRILSKGVNRYIEEIVSQHTELTLLYIMIERLSKTIDLEELKGIVVQIIEEALAADEIDMIFHKKYKDRSITSWTRAAGTISRKRIDRRGPMWPVIERWIDGGLPEAEVSGDGRVIYLPIAKGGDGLALIVIRKAAGAFDSSRLGLLNVMSNHISVAFENALLYHIAITDELTGLYTQRHFRTSIDRKVTDHEKYGEKFGLLLLDIDDFKKVNDTYGHVVGDSVLGEVARRMLISTRDSDVAFRYGGEEFAVILPSTTAGDAVHVAERIREEMAGYSFGEGSASFRVTISIGVSACPDYASTARELILTADKALYHAKRTGKNKVVLAADAEG